jgi:hypothetical protein
MVFPGCHSDVGGGFPIAGGESGLSDGALVWMTKQLRDRGVLFLDPPTYAAAPNNCAPAHQSWLTGIWAALPKGPRDFSQRPDIEESSEVAARMQCGPVIPDPSLPTSPYNPTNLPPGPTVA